MTKTNTQTAPTASPDPNKQSFNLVNFGEYYYPTPELQENLDSLIIFTENTKKRDIPSGSVFVYNDQKYRPEILKSDVGCGITGFVTPYMDFTPAVKNDVLRAVSSLGIHIGQGNHFIDFTTGYPGLYEKGIKSGMVFIHSDFNNENVVPTTVAQAKDLEKNAKEKRQEYIEKLSRKLGFSAKFLCDWTHNSVNQEDDKLVYRKGAINLNETGYFGVLALNPIDGLMLYSASFEKYRTSMQHGLGRIGSRGELQDRMEKTKHGIARGYSVLPNTSVPIDLVDQTYNSLDNYISNFGLEQALAGVCKPKFIVTTKL